MLILALLTPPAHACMILTGAEHVVVENPADISAPTAPGEVTVRVTRGVGPTCVGPMCSSTSCDDLGTVSLSFPASTDDTSVPEAIGYRLRMIDGTLPAGLSLGEPQRAARVGDDGTVSLPLVWIDDATNDQEPFDFTLGVTAIDEAGNESEEVEVVVSDAGAGAGCATVSGAGALATLLALGLAGARRRK